MSLVSLNAYAAMHNATKQAATGWKKRGVLVLSGALVDTEASDAAMRARDLGRFKQRRTGGKRTAGVRGLLDTPGREVDPSPAEGRAVDLAVDPWRTDDPSNLGVQIQVAATELAVAVKTNPHARPDFSDIFDLANTIMYWGWSDEREIIRWADWPSVVATKIAADIGQPKKAAAIRNSLEKHMEARMVDMLNTVDDVAELRAKHANDDLPV